MASVTNELVFPFPGQGLLSGNQGLETQEHGKRAKGYNQEISPIVSRIEHYLR